MARHMVLLHPDVPEKIFKGIWQVMGKGGIWTGIIKNRRKNGEYHWVRANATALIQDGKPIGYWSVRTSTLQRLTAVAERNDNLSDQMQHKARQSAFVRLAIDGFLL